MKILFKDHFKIPSTTVVEFQDIPLNEDLPVFICPFRIANTRHFAISEEIFQKMLMFLKKLNRDFIVPNDRKNGVEFLDYLHEPNEYRLGYSGSNKGKGIAPTRADVIFNALRSNRFTKHGVGVTNEAHNVLLLVKGIGQDIMSDTIANVCRDILADFTTKQCAKHGIKVTQFTFHYFDLITKTWVTNKFDLPEYMGKPIILIPKQTLSGSRGYPNNYNWFIAGHFISPEIINGKKKVSDTSKSVKQLKDGTKVTVVKEIRKEFGLPKEKLSQFAIDYSQSLDEFLEYAKIHYPGIDS